MARLPFEKAVEQILQRDSRYVADAYLFVKESLDFTIKTIQKNNQKLNRSQHISGQELLGGIRNYALEQFGPMSYTVLEFWGINQCEDFGEIVFNLVSVGVLGRTETDSREDFKNGYNFEEAFLKPFRPQKPISTILDARPRRALKTTRKRSSNSSSPKAHEA